MIKGVACCGNKHNEWRPAEAALFCIRAISTYVSVVEAEVMPQVCPKFLLMILFSFIKKKKKNLPGDVMLGCSCWLGHGRVGMLLNFDSHFFLNIFIMYDIMKFTPLHCSLISVLVF